MINKLLVSKSTQEKLDLLSNRLNLRRNILCRLGIGKSLAIKDSVKDFEPQDNGGYEFNRFTLTGDNDDVFKALVIQHENTKLSDNQYFSKYLRNHIERGVDLLHHEYERINSPIEFLLGLMN